MAHSSSFNIVDAVRFEMHVHGGRFIIGEFIIASIVVAGVIVLSIIQYFSSHLSFFGGLWIFSFLGILCNCLTISILAAKIRKKEGNRPQIDRKVNPKFLPIIFTVYIILPFVLWFVTCRQIDALKANKLNE